jgi:hypothetical protein
MSGLRRGLLFGLPDEVPRRAEAARDGALVTRRGIAEWRLNINRAKAVRLPQDCALLTDPHFPTAVGACIRKLLMLCYGVLTNRQPFDPDWSKKPR